MMATREALLEVSRGFGLADDVSLSALRSSQWRSRLRQSHKVRLLSRNQTIGVIVDPAVWQSLAILAEELLEDMDIEDHWADRVDHHRAPAAEAAAELMRRLQDDDNP